MFLFEWSPLRRICVHQAAIGTQGKKKRKEKYAYIRLKDDKSSLRGGVG